MLKLQKKAASPRETYTSFTSQWENTYGMLDILKDVFVFIVVTAAASGWVFMMLMIISFITLSYLHFTIEAIILISIVAGIAAAAWYIVKTVKKYRGMTFKAERPGSKDTNKT